MKLEPRHKQAAQRVAEGKWLDQRIADEACASRMQLWRWMQDPAFTALVDEHREKLHAAILKRGIADKQLRVAALLERHQLLQRVIEERAKRGQAEHHADTGLTPGGLPEPSGKKGIPAEMATGLMVKKYQVTQWATITEYAVDTGTLAELRAIEKQMAQEMGEWTEKRTIDYASVSDDELAKRASEKGLRIVSRTG